MLGHGLGGKAPGRVSEIEPYIAGHNLILVHAKIVEVYRRDFQTPKKGLIGITNNCDWREPASTSKGDAQAAQRALEFFLGWFADPIYLGISADQEVLLSSRQEWEQTDFGWNIVPWGCGKLLHWISERYNYPDIFITENGCALPEEDDVDVAVSDDKRVSSYREYLRSCEAAIAEDIKLKGYFAWTFMDNFEWEAGYSIRFWLHNVDYSTGKRTPKKSASWFTEGRRKN
ncbi:MAG: beta-glucosidase/6-phospho-beta-glucosidase/beta-galactosidase [Lentisphaeria bacterium]|jgi:beta-glucosidase/6-phospho-beta-glucosidase/beta-galactosidase